MKNIPRRVVTGIKNGQSVIVEDQIAQNVVDHFHGLYISDLWNTTQMPASLEDEVEIPNTGIPQTPKNGTYLRYVCIPPDKELGIEEEIGHPHPLMHQTQTLDYVVILSGEIYLVMEEGETLLQAGDVVIQRGTNHAWSNRSNENCIQLAVLIDASNDEKML